MFKFSYSKAPSFRRRLLIAISINFSSLKVIDRDFIGHGQVYSLNPRFHDVFCFTTGRSGLFLELLFDVEGFRWVVVALVVNDKPAYLYLYMGPPFQSVFLAEEEGVVLLSTIFVQAGTRLGRDEFGQ